MVKFVKLECTSCGATLKKAGFRHYKCPYCNTEYIMDMDVIIPAGQKKNKEHAADIQKRLVTTALCFFGIVMILFLVIAINAFSSSKPNTKPQNQQVQTPTLSYQGQSKDGLSSAYYQELITAVFDKSYKEVSPAEIAQITYLNSHSDNSYLLDYKLNDGELRTASISQGAKKSNGDLKYFTGLKYLHVPSYHTDYGALQSLPNLEYIELSMSPEEILKALPSPEKVKELRCSFSEGGLGAFEKFSNLKHLSIKFTGKTPIDLSKLGTIAGLESLCITAKGYPSLPFLSTLTGLKSLELHIDDLKEISNIKSLKQLTFLFIQKSEIITVDFLKEMPQLTTLRLLSCNKVMDYTPIAELSNLEELMMDCLYERKYPESYSKLTKVKRLSIQGFLYDVTPNDIAFLKDFPNVIDLDLSGCDYGAFSVIACMKNLETLRLRSGTNLGDISFLKDMPHLTRVIFNNANTTANTEVLFMIPTLKELYLNDTQFTIDLNLIGENHSLEILSMNNLNWKAFNTTEGPHTFEYPNWQTIPIAECLDLFKNFDHLKKLSIEGNKISDLSFVAYLPELEYLDLTNNYITDLSPLKQLTKLRYVACGENALTAIPNLDKKVIVDTETKAAKDSPFWSIGW